MTKSEVLNLRLGDKIKFVGNYEDLRESTISDFDEIRDLLDGKARKIEYLSFNPQSENKIFIKFEGLSDVDDLFFLLFKEKGYLYDYKFFEVEEKAQSDEQANELTELIESLNNGARIKINKENFEQTEIEDDIWFKSKISNCYYGKNVFKDLSVEEGFKPLSIGFKAGFKQLDDNDEVEKYRLVVNKEIDEDEDEVFIPVLTVGLCLKDIELIK